MLTASTLRFRLGALAALLALAAPLAAQTLVPREVPFQGVLEDSGTPVTSATDVTFRLFDAASGGTQVWSETQTVTPDADGVFAVLLGDVTDLPDNVGRPLWLEVAVGSDVLGPRTAWGAAPYALGLYGLTVTPDASGLDYGPNLVGGSPFNSVGPEVGSATISGGGTSDFPNTVTATFGTVGGGVGNTAGSFWSTVGGGNRNTAGNSQSTVGGGDRNTASGSESTVGGGGRNTASGSRSTVGGGDGNTASGTVSTVGGGDGNTASGDRSTVGGGERNTASGASSAVPGGLRNHARGAYSFAAGYYARAAHDGAFVWSDNSLTAADSLVSTGQDQFLVRAAGGVGVGTNAPEGAVHVAANSTTATPHLVLDEAGASDFARLDFRNANAAGYTWTVAGGGTDAGSLNLFTRGRNVVEFKADAADGGTSPNLIETSAGGASLTQGGVWTNASSVHLKTDFEAVDPEAVLTTLAEIPITRWRYRAEAGDVWHLGPMSQDFHAAFGLGASTESIGTVDADGVALAAAQGLYELAQRQAAQILDQQAEVAALTARLDAQQTQIDALARRLDALTASGPAAMNH